MSVVLVSFLVASVLDRNPESQREYHKAKYRFDNGEMIASTLVADAISKHYKVDKIILQGTVKSV